MKTKDRGWGKIGLVIFICVSFVALEWFLARKMPEGAVKITTEMPPAQTKGLDTLLSLNSTFLTYAVALFGGIGFYLKGVLKGEFELADVEWQFLVASGVLALFSIFFGHLLPYFTSVMLRNEILDLNTGAVQWPLRLQYLSLALSGSMFLVAALSAAGRIRKVATRAEKPGPASK
jgi:hypothetical protein